MISVVVPNYGRPELLELCLHTMRKVHEGMPLEIIVSDDGSGMTDELSEVTMSYGAELKAWRDNLGYGANANRGIAETKGDIVFVVNSDIQFTENIFGPMVAEMNRDKKIGICGLRLMYPDGRVQHGGIFKSQYDFGHFWHGYQDNADARRSKYLLAVTGAVHGLRREFLEKHRYEERYFLANEDTNLCARAWANGYRVFYVGAVSAIHAEGATRGATMEEKTNKSAKWTTLEQIGFEAWKQDQELYDFNQMFEEQYKANQEIGINDMSVLIERTGALGDVICLTGCLREIKRQFPDTVINIKTLVTVVFNNNPNVNLCSYDMASSSGRMITLDQCYEKRPKMGIIEAYCDVLGLDPEKCKPEMFSTKIDEMTLATKFDTNQEYIVIHPGVGWKNKTLPRLAWEMIINHFAQKFLVVVVGQSEDHQPINQKNVVNLHGQLNIQEILVLIRKAKYFIGNDSGIMHVCQCTNTPGSAIFTCAYPEHIICRDTITAITPPDLDCVGCLKRQPPPVNYCECPENKDYECVKRLTYKYVIEKVTEDMNVRGLV